MSGGADLTRLRRLLGVPELSWLVLRARRRMERDEPLAGTVSLAGASEAQRSAAERLLGRAPRGGASLTLRLEAVDEVLRRSGAGPDGLAAAVVALTGPVTSRRAVRDAEERAWREAYAPLGAAPTELTDWAERLRASGVVRRLAGTPEAACALLETVVTALRALPAEPPSSLPAFAARTLGSAHALDDGKPAATLVLSGVRALTGAPDGEGAEWRRRTWLAAGLLRDELSSTVLALGLRGSPALDWYADAGEPAVLTLRHLVRGPSTVRGPEVVRVCENPAVPAAAAEEHGARCRPLVCLQGQPSAAALTLLRRLDASGSELRYHGDFDWGGLRIAATLRRSVPWLPWRFTAADYRSAAERLPRAAALAGLPGDSPWDPPLAEALRDLQVRVEEEAVLDDLLTDLAP